MMRSCISASLKVNHIAPKMIIVARTTLARRSVSGQRHNFLSSLTLSAPEDESRFALILGKPGGGKGTISKKILKVSDEKIILVVFGQK
jgi:ABC-type Mn2+/Zn2+ transport system ATPase subunit